MSNERKTSMPASPTSIGILYGEGVGREVIDATVKILNAVLDVTGKKIEIDIGGLIGNDSIKTTGQPLTKDVIHFVNNIFEQGGSILCGPGGARFVYELRSHFGLYYKLSPIQPIAALNDARILRNNSLASVDIMMVRENIGGAYFGKSVNGKSKEGVRFSELTFGYSEIEVNNVLRIAERLALKRKKKITLVLKKDAIQDITNLWLDCIESIKRNNEHIDWQFLDVDHACYQLIASPHEFDVIVSPNMLGDIMADLGATILGSRGMSYSGNFSESGHAVFQTGHGAAYDIAGKDIANPIGQIFSMVMLLESKFNWLEEASIIRQATQNVLAESYRTKDIASESSRVIGTKAMGDIIAETIKSK
jgi:3-isopropylmalate dehydrogenase